MTPERFVADLPPGGTLLAAGISGYGKTTTVQAGLATSQRLLVIDPYSATDRRRARAGRAQRRTWEGDVWTYDELLSNPEALSLNPCRIICDPNTLDPYKSGQRVSRVLDWCWHVGDMDVVLEEAGLYSRWAVDLINRLATGGAHTGLRLYLIAQSLNRFAVDARRAASHWMLWAQVDEDDLRLANKKLRLTDRLKLARFAPGQTPVLWWQGYIRD